VGAAFGVVKARKGAGPAAWRLGEPVPDLSGDLADPIEA
jgi:hypothetical protein